MSKKIYICTSGTEYSKMMFKEFENNENIVLVHGTQREKNSLIKRLKHISLSRKVDKIVSFPFRETLYRSFFKNVHIDKNSEDTIIFFDNFEYSKKVVFLKWLSHKYPKLKLYMWYWNTLKDKTDISMFKKLYDKVATFDEKDAKKYDLKHLVQFFSKKIGEEYRRESSPKKDGVIFIGIDKGRIDFLEKCAKRFKEMNIPIMFHIFKDKKGDYSKERMINKYLTDKFLKYEEVLKFTGESGVILDFVKKDQEGFSLRVMESIFMRKKLITTNNKIKDFDFYNPNNILVINKEDDINEEFFNSLYQDIDEEILKKYDVNSWLKQFIY